LFDFGSYRLNVHSKSTDIDALVVAPRHIDRDKHFFGLLPNILRSQPETEFLIEVREAFVPCIKMIFNGIDIDLLFARVELKDISKDLELKDNAILRNCDPNSIRSLGGRRATDAILEKIPKSNLPKF
jgi:poly(A) polymerase